MNELRKAIYENYPDNIKWQFENWLEYFSMTNQEDDGEDFEKKIKNIITSGARESDLRIHPTSNGDHELRKKIFNINFSDHIHTKTLDIDGSSYNTLVKYEIWNNNSDKEVRIVFDDFTYYLRRKFIERIHNIDTSSFGSPDADILNVYDLLSNFTTESGLKYGNDVDKQKLFDTDAPYYKGHSINSVGKKSSPTSDYYNLYGVYYNMYYNNYNNNYRTNNWNTIVDYKFIEKPTMSFCNTTYKYKTRLELKGSHSKYGNPIINNGYFPTLFVFDIYFSVKNADREPETDGNNISNFRGICGIDYIELVACHKDEFLKLRNHFFTTSELHQYYNSTYSEQANTYFFGEYIDPTTFGFTTYLMSLEKFEELTGYKLFHQWNKGNNIANEIDNNRYADPYNFDGNKTNDDDFGMTNRSEYNNIKGEFQKWLSYDNHNDKKTAHCAINVIRTSNFVISTGRGTNIDGNDERQMFKIFSNRYDWKNDEYQPHYKFSQTVGEFKGSFITHQINEHKEGFESRVADDNTLFINEENRYEGLMTGGTTKIIVYPTSLELFDPTSYDYTTMKIGGKGTSNINYIGRFNAPWNSVDSGILSLYNKFYSPCDTVSILDQWRVWDFALEYIGYAFAVIEVVLAIKTGGSSLAITQTIRKSLKALKKAGSVIASKTFRAGKFIGSKTLEAGKTVRKTLKAGAEKVTDIVKSSSKSISVKKGENIENVVENIETPSGPPSDTTQQIRGKTDSNIERPVDTTPQISRKMDPTEVRTGEIKIPENLKGIDNIKLDATTELVPRSTTFTSTQYDNTDSLEILSIKAKHNGDLKLDNWIQYGNPPAGNIKKISKKDYILISYLNKRGDFDPEYFYRENYYKKPKKIDENGKEVIDETGEEFFIDKNDNPSYKRRVKTYTLEDGTIINAADAKDIAERGLKNLNPYRDEVTALFEVTDDAGNTSLSNFARRLDADYRPNAVTIDTVTNDAGETITFPYYNPVDNIEANTPYSWTTNNGATTTNIDGDNYDNIPSVYKNDNADGFFDESKNVKIELNDSQTLKIGSQTEDIVVTNREYFILKNINMRDNNTILYKASSGNPKNAITLTKADRDDLIKKFEDSYKSNNNIDDIDNIDNIDDIDNYLKDDVRSKMKIDNDIIDDRGNIMVDVKKEKSNPFTETNGTGSTNNYPDSSKPDPDALEKQIKENIDSENLNPDELEDIAEKINGPQSEQLKTVNNEYRQDSEDLKKMESNNNDPENSTEYKEQEKQIETDIKSRTNESDDIKSDIDENGEFTEDLNDFSQIRENPTQKKYEEIHNNRVHELNMKKIRHLRENPELDKNIVKELNSAKTPELVEEIAKKTDDAEAISNQNFARVSLKDARDEYIKEVVNMKNKYTRTQLEDPIIREQFNDEFRVLRERYNEKIDH